MFTSVMRLPFAILLLYVPVAAQTTLQLRGRYFGVEGTDCATGGWKTYVKETNLSSYDQTFPPFELRCGDVRIELSEIKFRNLPQDISGQVKLDPTGPINTLKLSNPTQFNASVKGSIILPPGTDADPAGVQIRLHSALDDTSGCPDKEDNHTSGVDFEMSLAPCTLTSLPYMSQGQFTAAVVPVNLSINAGQGKQFASIFVLFEMYYQPVAGANSIALSEEKPKRIQKPVFLSLAPLSFQGRLEFFFTADEADVSLRVFDQDDNQLATSKIHHVRKVDSPLNWVVLDTDELQIPDTAYKLVLKGILSTTEGKFESPPIEYPVANVKIDHIEGVQTVQTASNGVTLVTGDPVFVRVFLAQRSPKGDPIKITGELSATGDDGAPVSEKLIKGPLNGSISVPEAVNRSEKDHSLIFAVLPILDKNTTWEVKVKLKSDTGKDIEIEKNATQSKKGKQSLSFRHFPGPPLDLVIVSWRYWPPGLNLPRAGGQPALDLAGKILPRQFSVFWPSIPEKYRTLKESLTKGSAQKHLIRDVRLLERRFQKGEIPEVPGSLSANAQWIAVVPDLYRFPLDNGTTEEVEVLGMSNPLWDGGEGRSLWVQNLNVLGPDKASKVIAHELAHNFGLYHAGGTDLCAGAGPKGWTYKNSSIQEPGWDRSRMIVVPASSFDVMSNCNARNWVSPLTAQRLIDSQLEPAKDLKTIAPKSVARNDSAMVASPAEFLLVGGSVKRDGSSATLDPIFTSASNRSVDESNPGGEHCLVLRGSGDPQRFCFSLSFQIDAWGTVPKELDEEPFVFKIATIPGLSQVSLERDGAQLTSVSAGANPPSVRILSPAAGDTWDGGERTIAWEGSHPDAKALAYMVDYSFDGGGTWLPVTPAIAETQTTLMAEEIQGGDNVWFRVLASDGLRTGRSDVGPIHVKQRPAVELSPLNLDFHKTFAGVPRQASIRLESKGAGPVTIQSLSTDQPEFVVRRPAAPFRLPGGLESDILVDFVPGSAGDFAGTLTAVTDDPNKPQITVPLRGTGVLTSAPEIGLGADSIDFGSVKVGETATRALTVANYGTGSLTVSSLSIDSLQVIGDLAAPLRLEMEDVPLTLTFRPSMAGPLAATLTIRSNDPTRPNLTIPLRGTAIGAPVPKIAVSPTSLDFGNVTVQQSKSLALTIANRGDAPLNITALSGLSGAFAISALPPLTIGPGADQILTARFAPTTAGSQSGRLTIDSNDPAVPSVGVSVSGTGVAAAVPRIDASPTTLDFGAVVLQQSKTLTLTVGNRGDAPLNVSALSGLSGAFTVVSPASPFTVAPGATTPLSIRFAPVSTGSQSASLRIVSNDPDPARSTVTIALTGSGTAPAAVPSISISSSILDFGTVSIGQSTTLNLMVSNKGNAQLLVTSIASDSAQFVPLTNAFSLAAGVEFPVQVRFTPTSAGAQSATLALTSNDPLMPVLRAALKGTGVASGSGDITLKVDGGTFTAAMGYLDGSDVAVFVNRLTPPSYPATLKSVQIYFGNRSNGLKLGADFNLVIATNPTGSASFTAFSAGALYLVPVKVNTLGGFNTYTTPSVTLTSGDFVVGLLVSNPPAVLPVELDQTSPSQRRSYASSDAVFFTLIDDWGARTAGNFGIRAVVTAGSALSTSLSPVE